MDEHECNQKDNIAKLFTFHDEKMAKLHDMENRQIQIQGDVTHIKSRIDNGMSHTISDMSKNLIALMPIIERHTALEKRIEDLFWGAVKGAVWTVCLIILSFCIWGLTHGWKP